jgi:hypothetical protein
MQPTTQRRETVLILSYILSVAAMAVMFANVLMAFRLRKDIIGGEIGRRWSILSFLILFFLLGYIVSPLLLVMDVPVEIMGVLVFMVFLFGAIFVAVVIKIIRDTLSFMDLLNGGKSGVDSKS